MSPRHGRTRPRDGHCTDCGAPEGAACIDDGRLIRPPFPSGAIRPPQGFHQARLDLAAKHAAMKRYGGSHW